MTNLERLIKAHTEATTVITLSSATEKVAEEMAREAVNDPVFRTELKRLVRLFFGGTMHKLARNGQRPRTKARRRKTQRKTR